MWGGIYRQASAQRVANTGSLRPAVAVCVECTFEALLGFFPSRLEYRLPSN